MFLRGVWLESDVNRGSKAQIPAQPEVAQFVAVGRETEVFPFIVDDLAHVANVEDGNVGVLAGRLSRKPYNDVICGDHRPIGNRALIDCNHFRISEQRFCPGVHLEQVAPRHQR
jgi:hypothetical protein